jgi:hypothetical protein
MADSAIVDSSPEISPTRPPLDLSGREARVAEMLRAAPVSARGILSRAFAGEASPRDAIRAQCLACVGYQRDQVAGCTWYSCPLWFYRPYQPAP